MVTAVQRLGPNHKRDEHGWYIEELYKGLSIVLQLKRGIGITASSAGQSMVVREFWHSKNSQEVQTDSWLSYYASQHLRHIMAKQSVQSEFNRDYVCTISRVDLVAHLDPNPVIEFLNLWKKENAYRFKRIRVHFSTCGDMSLGTLQRAHHSTLELNGAIQVLSSTELTVNDPLKNIAGVLVYQVVEPFQISEQTTIWFSYGQAGYERVRLSTTYN